MCAEPMKGRPPEHLTAKEYRRVAVCGRRRTLVALFSRITSHPGLNVGVGLRLSESRPACRIQAIHY